MTMKQRMAGGERRTSRAMNVESQGERGACHGVPRARLAAVLNPDDRSALET